jgi:hypothetical protein
MLMAATIVFGIVAASRIGISQFPDVDFPNISVSVAWEGAAPEVIENDVVEVLETLVQVEMRTHPIAGWDRPRTRYFMGRGFRPSDRPRSARRRRRRGTSTAGHFQNNRDQPILFISLSGPFQRVLSDCEIRPEGEAADYPGVGET